MSFPYLHLSLLFLCQAKPVFTVNAHYLDGLNTGTFIATCSISVSPPPPPNDNAGKAQLSGPGQSTC